MRQAQINRSNTDLNYLMAAKLANDLADLDTEIIDPVLIAWYDHKAGRMSPVIEGASLLTRWYDYGASHSGKLEIDVAGEYAFIYADSSAFESYEASSPYANLHDTQDNEYLCQIGLLGNPHVPTKNACVPLDDWTSKLT